MRSALLCLFVLAANVTAADEILRDGQRVVFLGDSITFDGRFIAYLDAYLITRYPDKHIELINLGLPSETVTGLSEPDHPYPRPNVHDRLLAALEKSKPDVIVASYGMNDGIYYPFSPDRFKKYQAGFLKLIAGCEKAKAKVVLMTPSAFDPAPLKDKVQAKGAAKYSWMRPYSGYDDEVLTPYAKWLFALHDKGYPVADAHAAVRKNLAEMRKSDPAYRVAGDGVHPDANGHLVIFRALAKTLGLPGDGISASVDAAKGDSGNPSISGVKVGLNKVEFVWKPLLPMPRDPDWHGRLLEAEGPGQTGLTLTIAGLPAGKHALYEDNRIVGTASAEEWKKGVGVGQFPLLSVNKKAAALWKLVEAKNRVLGLAWLTDVGHKRPDTPKGIPLSEAQKRAKELDAKARELAKPVEMRLMVAPVK